MIKEEDSYCNPSCDDNVVLRENGGKPMKTQIFVNWMIFLVAMVVVTLMAFGASAQQPPAGAVQRSDGGWQVDAHSVWYPPQRTTPRAVPQVSIRSLPAPTTTRVSVPTYAPTSSTPVPVSSSQTAQRTRVGNVTAGISGHLNSYQRPQEVVGRQELQVEESRSGVYLDAARQDAAVQREANRLQVEQQRMALRRERDLQRMALDQQRQNQRAFEGTLDTISDLFNDSSRRQSQRERDELRARQQRQRELTNASRELQRWAEIHQRSKN